MSLDGVSQIPSQMKNRRMESFMSTQAPVRKRKSAHDAQADIERCLAVLGAVDGSGHVLAPAPHPRPQVFTSARKDQRTRVRVARSIRSSQPHEKDKP